MIPIAKEPKYKGTKNKKKHINNEVFHHQWRQILYFTYILLSFTFWLLCMKKDKYYMLFFLNIALYRNKKFTFAENLNNRKQWEDYFTYSFL